MTKIGPVQDRSGSVQNAKEAVWALGFVGLDLQVVGAAIPGGSDGVLGFLVEAVDLKVEGGHQAVDLQHRQVSTRIATLGADE